jgi:glycosyltransferase involved in cell wall biosynthesis
MSDPLVSALVITRQRPDLVVRAVDSVLRQSLPDVEVVVAIDGPDEETRLRLGKITDRRLRVRQLASRMGYGGARNAACGMARGEWVALLDDDDEWSPRKLEIQYAAGRHSPHPYPIVSCRLISRNEAGDLVWPRRYPRPEQPLSEYLFCQRGIFGGEGIVLPSTIFTRRRLFEMVPFRQDLKRHFDVDWLLRASAVPGAAVVFVPERDPLAVWHIGPGRERLSNTDDWRYSASWAKENRHRMTPHAYASFLLIWASLTAAQGRHWESLLPLIREARRNGRPQAIDFIALLAIWLVPERMRRKLTSSFDRLRRGERGEPSGKMS